MSVIWEKAGPPNRSPVTGAQLDLHVCWGAGSSGLLFSGHCTGPGSICDFFPMTVSRSICLWGNRAPNTPFFSEPTNFSNIIIRFSVPLVPLLTHTGVDAPPPGRASLHFVIMWLLLLIPLGNPSHKLLFVSSLPVYPSIRRENLNKEVQGLPNQRTKEQPSMFSTLRPPQVSVPEKFPHTYRKGCDGGSPCSTVSRDGKTFGIISGEMF